MVRGSIMTIPIFILDSGSTDKTIEIGEQYGATFLDHAFENHPRQWDFALKNFPVTTDFAGIALSTVLKEHVDVILNEEGKEDAVYLR